MASHYTRGSITTLRDFGGGLGTAFGHFFGLSRSHGHGSWLVCKVALSVRATSHTRLRARDH